MHTTSCLIVIQSIAFAILNVGEGQAEDCPHERARCGRCQISETSYNQFRRVFFNILSGSGGWVANPTQRPKCMTSSTTVAVRPLIFPFLLFLLFLCKKGTGAFLQRTWKMLRMMRLPFLLFWVAPHWYLRYLTQRSASSLIGSIRINIGIRHLVWAACHPHQTPTMGWHRVAPPRKTLRRCYYMSLMLVGVQAAKLLQNKLFNRTCEKI